MNSLATQPARASGEFAIGGDLPVVRLGYGAMQIPGPGVWGEPRDHNEVIRVLRRALELGVTLIDTADSYGPKVSERLIHEALHLYPDDLVIATEAGMTRPGPWRWERKGKPEHLKAQANKSLHLLGLERIEVFQLYRIDPEVPLADQLGALVELQAEGKIGRIGLPEVLVPEIQAAKAITPIATVQNRYNLAERGAEPVLDYCQREGIGFIPWFPMATGRLARPGGPLQRIADEQAVTPAQVALVAAAARTGSAADVVEQMAHDAMAFLAAMELDQVDLLGFSIGSFVAQEIVWVPRTPLTSRGPAILVDQPAESIKPHDPCVACWSGRRDGSQWWRLVE